GYGASGYGYASAPYPTFGGNVIAPAPYPAPYPASMPMPMHIPTPQYMYGPQFVSQSYQIPSTTRHVYHTAPTPAPIINRVIHHQAPAVQPEIRTIHVYQQDVAPTYSTQHSSQQFYIKGLPIAPAISTLPAPAYVRSNGVYCYSGSNKRYDSYGNEIFQSASCG
ncbi:MAG: hypothetical protein JKX72_07030, partial [Robiginitomaculum sp.]|nr:hypothetical protein [Robiginitomaculum sp.]